MGTFHANRSLVGDTRKLDYRHGEPDAADDTATFPLVSFGIMLVVF